MEACDRCSALKHFKHAGQPMKRTILSVMIILPLLVACAGVDDKDGKPQLKDDKEYVTGSNLPRRKTSLPSEASTQSDQAVEEMRRIRPGPVPMGSGR
jgi:hypothetical protein